MLNKKNAQIRIFFVIFAALNKENHYLVATNVNN